MGKYSSFYKMKYELSSIEQGFFHQGIALARSPRKARFLLESEIRKIRPHMQISIFKTKKIETLLLQKEELSILRGY